MCGIDRPRLSVDVGYWVRIVTAFSFAVWAAFHLSNQGFSFLSAGLIGVCVYVGLRWGLAWIVRTHHWRDRGSYNVDKEKCPNCNAYRYRQSGDWVLRCHECGWTAGWPIVRWITKSVPAVQLRRTVLGPNLFVVIIASVLLISGATAGVGVGEINSTLHDAVSSADWTTDSELNRTKIELKVHQFVNQERRERGLSPLEFDKGLREIARYHSRDMAVNGYFAHTAPDGESMEDRYDKFGYSCRVNIGGDRYMTGGENIAYTYAYTTIDTKWGEVSYDGNETKIARGIVKQWMHSAGHRKNILRPYWNAEGIGIYIIEVDSGTRVYATQNFC